ncbi:MAG: hypothetical protein ACR2P2_10650 [Nakamurella sp.]
MNTTDDAQLEDAIRKSLAARAAAVRPVEHSGSSSGWHRRWLPALVAAAVVIIASVVAWPHVFSSQQPAAAPSVHTTTRGPDYSVYRGHRWDLKLSGTSNSGGFIQLDKDGKITLWNTQQQELGTYTIETTGQLQTHWTGTSSGMVNFDQVVVDAMSPIGSAPIFIRSTDPTTLVLETAGHRLTFTKHQS